MSEPRPRLVEQDEVHLPPGRALEAGHDLADADVLEPGSPGADLTLTIDRNGNLVNKSTGHLVQGWLANADGEIPSGSPLHSIHLPFDQSIPGRATTEVNVGANLDATA